MFFFLLIQFSSCSSSPSPPPKGRSALILCLLLVPSASHVPFPFPWWVKLTLNTPPLPSTDHPSFLYCALSLLHFHSLPPPALHTMNVISFTAWAFQDGADCRRTTKSENKETELNDDPATWTSPLGPLFAQVIVELLLLPPVHSRPASRRTPPPESYIVGLVWIRPRMKKLNEWNNDRPKKRTLIETIVNCYCVGKSNFKITPPPTNSLFAGELMYCYL